MNARHPEDDGNRRRASDTMLRSGNFLRPAPRLFTPAVPRDLLIERIRRDTMPCPWYLYPLLAIEVVGYLIWAGVRAVFRLRVVR